MKKILIKRYFPYTIWKKIHIFVYVFCFGFVVFSGGYFFLNFAKSAAYNYLENFITTLYKNSPTTTGKWDIVLNEARLLGKDWVNMALTSDEPDNLSNTSGTAQAHRKQLQIEGINGYENISDNSGLSTFPKFALDAAGNPYVVWQDMTTGSGDIYFSKWTPGIGWTKMNGSAGYENLSGTILLSSNVQIELDSANLPYVVWQDNTTGNGDIYFRRWNSGSNAWTNMAGTAAFDNISNNISSSTFPVLQLDLANNPCIVWADGAKADVYFTKWDAVNGWSMMVGGAGFDIISNTTIGVKARAPYLIIDSGNKPYVVWEDYLDVGGLSRDVFFTHWDGIKWAKMDGTNIPNSYENLSNNVSRSEWVQLQLDSANNPYIVWQDNVSGSFRPYLTKWTGAPTNAWTYADGITPGIENVSLGTNGAEVQIRIDTTTDTPYILWNNFDIYATYWDGAKWAKLSNGTLGSDNLSNNTGGSRTHRFWLDGAGNPLVSWVDPTIGVNEIYFTKFTTAIGWTKMDGVTLGYENISKSSGNSDWAQILLDSGGDPYVVWSDATTGVADIYLTKWTTGVGWTGLSSTADPYVVWMEDNGGNSDVFFSKWTTNTGWTKMDGTPGSENISNSSEFSSGPQLLLDYANNPYIAWVEGDYPGAQVYFTRWNPDINNWAKMNGTVGYDIVSSAIINTSNVEFAFNSNKQPYLLWTQNDTTPGVNDIFFSRWNGVTWTGADGIDDDGNPATFDNDNLTSTPTITDQMQKMVIDSNDRPYVVWQDFYPGDIYFTKWDGTKWAKASGAIGKEQIDNPTGLSGFPLIHLDNANNPYVFWINRVTGISPDDIWGVRYIPTVGWRKMDGTVGFDNVSNSPTQQTYYYSGGFAMANNKPYLTWSEDVDPGEGSVMDTVITYWDGATWAKLSDGTAGYDNLSNDPIYSSSPVIIFDSANNPYVYWLNSGSFNDQLVSRFVPGTGWTKMDGSTLGFEQIVSTNINSYTADSFKLNANDIPYVIYVNDPIGIQDLFFIRWLATYKASSIIQSTNINTRGGIVSKATLTANEILNGQTIIYSLSNDGGLNWTPVTSGVEYSFLSNGGDLRWQALLATGNTAVTPVIDDLTIDYVATTTGVFVSTSPSAPIDLTCEAISPDTIRWNFTDTANPPNEETGFRLYGPEGKIYDTGDIITQDLTYLDEINLQPNTLYPDRYVTAFNGAGESSASNTASCYTLANTPLPPEILGATEDSITFKINPADNNPPNTEYAIIELTSNQYVNPDGTFSYVENWQNYSGWGGDNGVIIGGEILPIVEEPIQPDAYLGNENLNTNESYNVAFKIALASGQNFQFAAKARNGAGIETAFSGTTSGSTTDGGGTTTLAPIIAVTKGVGINLALNNQSDSGLIKAALAYDEFIPKVTTTGERMLLFLQQFFIFLLILLIFFILLLILGLHGAIKHLAQNLKFKEKVNLIWHLITKEPALVFSLQAPKDHSGTFQISFEQHKKMHSLSQKNFRRILGLAIIDIIILIVLISALNHNSGAQGAPYNQSGQEVSVGDKLSYIIEVANSGNLMAGSVVVADTLNSNLIFDSGSAKIVKGGQTVTSGIGVAGSNLSFNVGDLNIGQSAAIYFTAAVKSGSEGQTITNTATSSGSNFTSAVSNTTSNLVIPSEEIPVVKAVCGNGKIEAGEQCDDGNKINGDGCSAGCQTEEEPLPEPIPGKAVCGNGKVEAGEQCDDGNTASNDGCSAACQNDAEVPPLPEEPIPLPVPPPTPPVPPAPVPPLIPLIPPNVPIIGPIAEEINNNETVQYIQQNIIDNPQVEQFSQNVIMPALLVIALANTIPSAIILTVGLLPYLHLLFVEPFLWLFRKKRKKWGVVYDALTKLPIGLAVVRLYNQSDNKLVQTKVTDTEGRYLLMVKEPGKYYLGVNKVDYQYPTKFLQNDKEDTKYLDLYHGEAIEVKAKESVITANIPLDPKDKRVLTEKEAVRSYLLKNTRLIVSFVGMILSLLVVLIYPTVLTVLALAIHVVLYFIFRKLIVPPKPKSWGIVYDQKNKQPLSYAVVRIFETKFNKLLETQVTDGHGRYSFLVGKNQYQLLTEKQGYQKKEIKPVDLIKNEKIVNLDVGLEKV